VPSLTRPYLRALDPATFWWCAGIEDTFISSPSPRTGRRLDEYELTQHYDRWSEDLVLMASLGIGAARYGIPWYRINPRPGQWDWTWADRPIQRLLDLGIEPILDLVHYGVPGWIEHSFVDPCFPDRLADYAGHVAERYHGRVHAFTPLNEPRITAWYAGRLGWWPPHLKSWEGFARVLMGICRGVAMATETIRAAHSWNVIVHADGADSYGTDNPDLRAEARFRQDLVFLPLDLLSGELDEADAIGRWLVARGIGRAELEWHRSHKQPPDVMGLNVYPMFSNKLVTRKGGRLRVTSIVRNEGLVTDAVTKALERWSGPIMITETAGRGGVGPRLQWLRRSLQEVRELRRLGRPVIGYTWWPMISHIAWAYREGTGDVARYVEKMGLWDLAADFSRVETLLVPAYRQLIAGGMNSIGDLHAPVAG
jgi:beta-glucosidase